GPRASYAPMGKRVVFVLGGDDVLKRSLAAAKAGDGAPPNALSKAISAAGPDAVGYFRYDVTALMRSMSDVMPGPGGRTLPPPPAGGEPVVITGIRTGGRGELRGRLWVDVGKFAKRVESMKPK